MGCVRCCWCRHLTGDRHRAHTSVALSRGASLLATAVVIAHAARRRLGWLGWTLAVAAVVLGIQPLLLDAGWVVALAMTGAACLALLAVLEPATWRQMAQRAVDLMPVGCWRRWRSAARRCGARDSFVARRPVRARHRPHHRNAPGRWHVAELQRLAGQGRWRAMKPFLCRSLVPMLPGGCGRERSVPLSPWWTSRDGGGGCSVWGTDNCDGAGGSFSRTPSTC